MISCVCTAVTKSGYPCSCVVNYHGTITLEQVKENPPFSSIPPEEGEHKHVWNIKEVKFGR